MKLFTDFLRDIRKGRVVDDATVKLAQVVRAVQEHGKAGSLTLTLSVSPQAGDKGIVTITPSLSAKLPEASIPNAIFYVDAEGGLSREDPNQGDFIRDAATLTGGVRTVG
jgi:hypothetical protein